MPFLSLHVIICTTSFSTPFPSHCPFHLLQFFLRFFLHQFVTSIPVLVPSFSVRLSLFISYSSAAYNSPHLFLRTVLFICFAAPLPFPSSVSVSFPVFSAFSLYFMCIYSTSFSCFVLSCSSVSIISSLIPSIVSAMPSVPLSMLSLSCLLLHSFLQLILLYLPTSFSFHVMIIWVVSFSTLFPPYCFFHLLCRFFTFFLFLFLQVLLYLEISFSFCFFCICCISSPMSLPSYCYVHLLQLLLHLFLRWLLLLRLVLLLFVFFHLIYATKFFMSSSYYCIDLLSCFFTCFLIGLCNFSLPLLIL